MTNELSFEEVKFQVEAILFSYGDWITVSEIMDSLGMDSELLVKNALEELVLKFNEGYSFLIEQDEGKYRMTLHTEYDQIVTSLISGTEIPRNVLKVLSVIAYEQPVTKTRLSEILGRYVKNEVEYLYKLKFLSYEKKGIGKYFKVTKKFYDYFKIDEDDDFRKHANKNIQTFLEEPMPLTKSVEEPIDELNQEETFENQEDTQK